MSDNLPSVSVVIATRNRPELLAKAIDGAISQDYAGVVDVTIVYDHVDPDLSLAFDRGNRAVRVIVNDHRQGLPGARNCGVANSTGDLIAFCDDDDEWLPGKLARQVEELARHPECEFVTTGIRITYDGESHDRPSPVTELSVEHLVHDRTLEAHPSSYLLTRSLIERIGPVDVDIPGGYSEDYDFILRAARATTVRCVIDPLVLVRWGGSLFSDRWSMIVDAQRYMLAKHPEFSHHRRAEARIRGQVAFALAASGRRRESLRELVTTVKRWPLERRWPVALVIATGAIKPATALRLAHKAGRGI